MRSISAGSAWTWRVAVCCATGSLFLIAVSPENSVSSQTRVPRHGRARLTFGLHFPHRRLILCPSSDAKAPPGDRRPTQGIGSLRYLFEGYAFDTDRRELRRGANAVSVAPQVFDLPDYLIRNRSQPNSEVSARLARSTLYRHVGRVLAEGVTRRRDVG